MHLKYIKPVILKIIVILGLCNLKFPFNKLYYNAAEKGYTSKTCEMLPPLLSMGGNLTDLARRLLKSNYDLQKHHSTTKE